MQPLLSVSDVFLLPSKEESFGLAALEAMACGVPVVGARVGGVPEVIEHGVSGFLHDADAVDEMAASVMRLLTNPDLHRTMADAATRRVRGHFGADRVVPMYEAAYERLLATAALACPLSKVGGEESDPSAFFPGEPIRCTATSVPC